MSCCSSAPLPVLTLASRRRRASSLARIQLERGVVVGDGVTGPPILEIDEVTAVERIGIGRPDRQRLVAPRSATWSSPGPRGPSNGRSRPPGRAAAAADLVEIPDRKRQTSLRHEHLTAL